MAGQAQSRKEQPLKQPVQVLEADLLDRMNETDSLIAERAYEIYQTRGGGHGSDQDDWFSAEEEVLYPLSIEREVAGNELRLTAQVPGFDAKDLEVVIAHRRAVICGVHSASKSDGEPHRKNSKLMRIVELPFAVDPESSTATIEGETLEVVLPRLL